MPSRIGTITLRSTMAIDCSSSSIFQRHAFQGGRHTILPAQRDRNGEGLVAANAAAPSTI
jgi:hypothetical protein